MSETGSALVYSGSEKRAEQMSTLTDTTPDAPPEDSGSGSTGAAPSKRALKRQAKQVKLQEFRKIKR